MSNYCNEKEIPCNTANENGHCKVTGCSKDIDISVKSHDICSTCKYGWSGRCDLSLNPLTCDKWEPD